MLRIQTNLWRHQLFGLSDRTGSGSTFLKANKRDTSVLRAQFLMNTFNVFSYNTTERQKSSYFLTVRIRGRESNRFVVRDRIYLVESDHFLELLATRALLGGRTGGSGAMWEKKIREITRKSLALEKVRMKKNLFKQIY
jgi:hypothetical protein